MNAVCEKKEAMKRKAIRSAAITALALAVLLTAMLSGCGAKNSEAASTAAPATTAAPVSTTAPVSTAEPVGTPAPTEPPEAAEEPPRQDGERFETVVLLEGMEETVRYEHVKNESVGFELDYEYENLLRSGGPEGERFVSVYDDPEDPGNYLEITYRAEDADTLSESIYEEFMENYDTMRGPSKLACAGSCTRIDVYDGKSDGGPLETVYIIPAAEGCLVAAAHYSMESAEGFGARFRHMLNTLAVIDRIP